MIRAHMALSSERGDKRSESLRARLIGDPAPSHEEVSREPGGCPLVSTEFGDVSDTSEPVPPLPSHTASLVSPLVGWTRRREHEAIPDSTPSRDSLTVRR
jgi:hypothetical protein